MEYTFFISHTSYFGDLITAIASNVGSFYVQLIKEFYGSSDITEWLEKVELVCKFRKITGLSSVIPQRLGGGAFAVYQQINDCDKAIVA